MPCRIVIADVDADVRLLLTRTVQSPSHDIKVVRTPAELIAQLQKQGADVLMFDPVLLGWRPGLEFCRTVTNTSIVVVTSRTSQEEREAARLAGAMDVITKPFSPSDVRRRVAAACPRHRLSG